MESKKPPRVLGILLALLGLAMVVGELTIFKMSTGGYFLVIGLGLVVSGALLALGKLIGAYMYGVTLAIIIVWSFLEVGIKPELVARIAMPILIGFYIAFGGVRSRLG